MKLTNNIREAFVRAVMADVPAIDYAEQIRKLVHEDAISQLPPKVRAIYKDAATAHFVNVTHWSQYTDTSVAVPAGRGTSFKLSVETKAKVDELQAQGKDQRTKRNDLKARLEAVAASVTTRKALAEALPEFEKYLPADEAAALRTVPVIANVVADFVKAGWPKGSKSKQVAATA
jgi:hypothetical protein